MKKLILAAVAASMVAAPAIAAPQRGDHGHQTQRQATTRHDNGNHYGQRNQRTVVVQRTTYHAPQVQYRNNWRRGERFDARYARNYRQVDYRQVRGLRAPPRGYQYVRSGNDAVLIAVGTGLIAAVLAGAFN